MESIKLVSDVITALLYVNLNLLVQKPQVVFHVYADGNLTVYIKLNSTFGRTRYKRKSANFKNLLLLKPQLQRDFLIKRT
jgi:hypothetical protein